METNKKVNTQVPQRLKGTTIPGPQSGDARCWQLHPGALSLGLYSGPRWREVYAQPWPELTTAPALPEMNLKPEAPDDPQHLLKAPVPVTVVASEVGPRGAPDGPGSSRHPDAASVDQEDTSGHNSSQSLQRKPWGNWRRRQSVRILPNPALPRSTTVPGGEEEFVGKRDNLRCLAV
ncbi:uncharacterized protein ACBT57_004456 isoform 1-T1 [Dama dama]